MGQLDTNPPFSYLDVVYHYEGLNVIGRIVKKFDGWPSGIKYELFMNTTVLKSVG
jgi:hypothetical protein